MYIFTTSSTVIHITCTGRPTRPRIYAIEIDISLIKSIHMRSSALHSLAIFKQENFKYYMAITETDFDKLFLCFILDYLFERK